MLLTNGRIHTMDAAGSVVDCLVVRDGRVYGYSTDAAILAGLEFQRAAIIGEPVRCGSR